MKRLIITLAVTALLALGAFPAVASQMDSKDPVACSRC